MSLKPHPTPQRPFCHRSFTVLAVAPAPKILGAPIEEPRAQMLRCLGPDCAAFVQETDASGRLIGGLCSDPMQAIALARLAEDVAAIAEEVTSGPNDDAPPAGEPASA